MAPASPTHPSRDDPNGPTWRSLALVSLALLVTVVVVVAALTVVPVRSVPRVGVAYSTERFPGNGSLVFDPRANISFPSGATLTSIAANYSIGGGYRLNLTVGWCLPGFGICGPSIPSFYPTIYHEVNRSYGAFGWACGQPYACNGRDPEMYVYGALGQSWTLSWEVTYNYTATEPFL